LRARGDLHLDLGIGLIKRREHGLKDQRDNRPGNREAQEPGGTLPQVPRGLARGDEFLESGLCARQEALAGFGQADAAGCADEKRGADTRLKCTYHLANRRRRHAEFRGRSAKTAVLGDAQERRYAVERALSDCEALLHGLSTLSTIVARR